MDSIKLEQLITENMKSIFGFALSRLGNVAEAEWLASDILCGGRGCHQEVLVVYSKSI